MLKMVQRRIRTGSLDFIGLSLNLLITPYIINKYALLIETECKKTVSTVVSFTLSILDSTFPHLKGETTETRC